MIIALANDHAGYILRGLVLEEITRGGHQVLDCGHDGTDSVDYPDYAARAARAVAEGKADRAILICGTGIGMSIAANKIPGIRCALCYDAVSAEMARHHNDANVLALRGRNADAEATRQIVRTFLREPFEGGRHQRRLDLIARLDSKA